MLFLNLCGAGTWSRHLDPAKSQRTQHPKGLRSDARFLALLPQFNRMLRARARAKLRFRVQHRGKKRGRKNPAAAGRALALACVKVRTLLILTCRVLRLLHSRTHSARASAATSRTHGHRCGPPRAPGCALLETGLGR